jgi:hypothetical protein
MILTRKHDKSNRSRKVNSLPPGGNTQAARKCNSKNKGISCDADVSRKSTWRHNATLIKPLRSSPRFVIQNNAAFLDLGKQRGAPFTWKLLNQIH